MEEIKYCISFEHAARNNKQDPMHPAKKQEDRMQEAAKAWWYSNRKLEYGHPLPFEGV